MHRKKVFGFFPACAACWGSLVVSVFAVEESRLVFDAPQLAGISGFRRYWDQPVVLSGDGVVEVVDMGEFGRAPSAVWAPEKRGAGEPGALVVDALHRRALVRFPGLAAGVHAHLAAGWRIERVDLLLPYRDAELWPFDYSMPSGMSFLGDAWARVPPRWHVVAWPLRRPWQADPETGPTFNAWINGAAYWRGFGALDEAFDRFPRRFGPVEVSYREATAYRKVQDAPVAAPAAPATTPVAEGPAGDDLFDGLLNEIVQDAQRLERAEDFDQPARLDLTALLTDDTFGETVGERLRRFEECGLLLAKWELYDLRYKDVWSGYEWGTMTGGRGILMRTPRLEITFSAVGGAAPAPAPAPLPPASDLVALAAAARRDAGSGEPPARVASRDAFAALLAERGSRQPAWMPDWQWRRVSELMAAEETPGLGEFPHDYERYLAWIDELLSWAPRQFIGHRTPRRAAVALRHREAMPASVRHHLERYWQGWLMPERDWEELVHPQAGDSQLAWLREHDDWRGNTSYYRAGYTRAMSTMNFNHTSVAGALLGGALIGAEKPMADGRYGLERQILRLWSWLDGSTQETIDHYYLAVTLFAIKDLVDFAPEPLDRLMARSALTKYIQQMSSLYHPGLRRFVSTSGRTALNYIWATQDGTQHVVHTLSHGGALREMDNDDTFGMPVLGQDFPARDVASQTLVGPWAPDWIAAQVDAKPLPFESTAAFRQWGGFGRQSPRWRRSYLSHHYGMASQDNVYGRIGFLAQWRRDEAPVERLQEVGTLLVRPGANQTELVASDGGALAVQGRRAILQHRNIALIVTQPPVWKEGEEDLRSLQTTLGFFDFRENPDWEIYVDGRRLESLPHTGELDCRVVVRDGASYIGVVPLPATDLGREYGLSIRRDESVSEIGSSGVMVGPALLLESYFLKKPPTRRDTRRDQAPQLSAGDQEALLVDTPRDPLGGMVDDLLDDLTMTDEQRGALQRMQDARGGVSHAFGGVVLRLADRNEFPDVRQFIDHLQAAELEVWDDAENPSLKHVRFRDGQNGAVLEAGYRVDRGWFASRHVDGQWPYLPVGLVLDTPLSVQGDVGRLDKNDFSLHTRTGTMAFLHTAPEAGACLALNPLPDLRPLSLTLPNGVEITADGLLGLASIEVREQGGQLVVDHALKAEQREHPDVASALLVFGREEAPDVVLDGEATPAGALQRVAVGERTAWLIPLPGRQFAAERVVERYHESRVTLSPEIPADRDALLQDWYVAGPFPNPEGSGFTRAFGPEEAPVDVRQTFIGVEGREVGWERLNPGGVAVGDRGLFNLYQRYAPHREWITVYAYTRIQSDRAREVLLLAGSDDAITVWLNGEKLHEHDVYRALGLDQERIPLTLRQGDNHLLLKICQGTGGWGFVARLADPRWHLPITEGLTIGFGEDGL